MLTPDSFQRRLMLAILAAGAASGCGKESVRSAPDEAPKPLPVTTTAEPAAAPPSVDSAPAPPPAPAPAPKSICASGGSAQESCFAPRSNARATGTGEPGPPPAPSELDENGCLPSSKVTNSCCNGAADGPRFKNGQCCYSFCPGPCCGRPFLVDGVPRVAPVMLREDWLASDAMKADAPELASLDAATRHALRDEWLGDAQMEHASAAAFARFQLQLLSLGAPPALVRGAALAAVDEVRHAELCFALAARFATGRSLGPEPLSLAGAFERSSLDDIVANAIVEGCVGETIAALTAARQLEAATDRAVRAALEEIHADEARHAELAWSFVAWAVANGGESTRLVAAAEFERVFATASSPTTPSAPASAAWRAFGRLAASEQRETARRALDDVIRPCARQLHLLGNVTAGVTTSA